VSDAAQAAAPELPVRRDHLTRFSSERRPGKTGRPKAAKDRLTRAFISAFADDFDQYGAMAIECVRIFDTTAYLRVAASLIPKEIDVRVGDDIDSERIERAIEMLNAIIDARPKDITADVEVVNAADD
jgi:hypothetical protein